MQALNDVYRGLFYTGEVDLFFDYDKDLWSMVNFEYNWDNRDFIFKDDGRHPDQHFQGPAADKMLGRLYSSNYHIFDKDKGKRERDVVSLLADPNLDVRLAMVEKVVISGENVPTGINVSTSILYYITRDSDTKKRIKWAGTDLTLNTAAFCLHVGIGEVLFLPSSLLAQLSTHPVLPFFPLPVIPSFTQ